MTEQSRSSDFFTAGGTLSLDAPSYVERPADDELFDLALAGQFCYVLTARQLGKSSLMVRTARRLQEHGASTAIIDLTKIGTREITIDQWYLGLITRLKAELDLTVDPDTWWAERASLGPVQRFTDFLRDVVLQETEEPVVIFTDEIDSTLNLDFSDDFFAAIRAMYNARANDPELNRLTFVLLGVATPTDMIKDRTRTPFNIGQGIALQEFSHADAQVLEQGVEAVHPGQGKDIFDRIFYWTNGHPYLTQKLCLEVAKSEDGTWTNQRVDELVERLFLSESEKAREETNLQFVRDRINESPQRRRLLTLYRKVYKEKAIPEDKRSPEQNRLKLFGLVRTEDGVLKVRNEIYRRVFDLAWVRANTPRNWAPIAVGTALLIALLAVGFVIHNVWVANQVDASTLKFYQATAPEERVARLADIFEPPCLFQVTDYDYQARELFYGLSREEQLALFDVSNVVVEDSDMIVLIKGLYMTLADVDGTDSTRPLLEAMVKALGDLVATEETSRLEAEINNWLQGRELVQQNQYADALADYNKAIALNGENPATLYERARVLIELPEPDNAQALSDLDQVMAIARRVPTPAPIALSATTPAVSSTLTTEPTTSPILTPTSTPLPTYTPTPAPITSESATPTKTPLPTYTPTPAPTTPEFATIGQMIGAVRSIIYSNPGLASSLVSASSSEYPNLREFGLVPKPPKAVIRGPTSGMVGERLSFSGADSTDEDGRIVSYTWDFGDGTTGSGVNVTHVYTAAGTYRVTLTVTDDSGLSDSVIAVVPPIATPVVIVFTPTPLPASPTTEAAAAEDTPTPAAVSTSGLRGKILFTVYNELHGKYDLYIANIDGSDQQLLYEQTRQPEFRGDGLIVANGDGGGWDGLVVMNADGSNRHLITNYPEDQQPSWSPDGVKVVHSSGQSGRRNDEGNPIWHIYIQDDASRQTEARALQIGNYQVMGNYPTWLPDGRIAFSGCKYWTGEGGNCGLWALWEDGTGVSQLTNASDDLSVDGYGDEIVFMGDQRDGNWEIYKADNVGQGITRLTNDPAIDGLPIWSSDGKHIAFLSTRDGQWAIWAMNADGSNQRKLFDLPGSMGPDWHEERISWWAP